LTLQISSLEKLRFETHLSLLAGQILSRGWDPYPAKKRLSIKGPRPLSKYSVTGDQTSIFFRWNLIAPKALAECRSVSCSPHIYATVTFKGLKAIAFHWKPIPKLLSVTYHMGSHAVICRPTQVNIPCLNPHQTDWYSIPGGIED